MVKKTGKSSIEKISALAKKAGLDYFIIGLISMIALAKVWPEGGLGDSTFALPLLANYAVSLIFFFYGLRLNKQKLSAGLSNWRLHILVQASTFIFFPLLILLVKPLFPADHHYLWLGTFFLASLPSTVSSSVVMVSVAEGNLSAAIFNASISGVLGVFVTPVWISFAGSTTDGSLDTGAVMAKLFIQVLLPVLLGVLLNSRWGSFAERNKKQLKYLDQLIILTIVYTSFAESFARNMFVGLSFAELAALAIGMLLLFFLTYSFISFIGIRLNFNREDRIAAVFCGSKKSLVHGTVMSKVLFAGSTATGLILLPLMLYHALQLICSSIIAQKWAREMETDKVRK